MDADTRSAIDKAIRDQQAVNRNMLTIIRSLIALSESQLAGLTRVSEFAHQLAMQISDSDDLADAPMLPTPDDLRKQSEAIDELKRIFGVEPSEPVPAPSPKSERIH